MDAHQFQRHLDIQRHWLKEYMDAHSGAMPIPDKVEVVRFQTFGVDRCPVAQVAHVDPVGGFAVDGSGRPARPLEPAFTYGTLRGTRISWYPFPDKHLICSQWVAWHDNKLYIFRRDDWPHPFLFEVHRSSEYRNGLSIGLDAFQEYAAEMIECERHLRREPPVTDRASRYYIPNLHRHRSPGPAAENVKRGLERPESRPRKRERRVYR